MSSKAVFASTAIAREVQVSAYYQAGQWLGCVSKIMVCTAQKTMYSGPDRFRLQYNPDIGVAFGFALQGSGHHLEASPWCQRDARAEF